MSKELTIEEVLEKHYDELVKKYPDEQFDDFNSEENEITKEFMYAAMQEWASLTPKGDEWISVSERLPTLEDAPDEWHNEVLTTQVGRKRPTMMKYWELRNCPFTKAWMKIPPLPSPIKK